ncbi:hypothetical protein JTS96_09535 [Clostridium botulinum]|nr:hypothetical protein [Clostridium botulinum]
MIKVGVLNLQGSVVEHMKILEKINEAFLIFIIIGSMYLNKYNYIK